MSILAIDPGVACIGWAWLCGKHGRGGTFACGIIRPHSVQHAIECASKLVDEHPHDDRIIEIPRIYAASRQKGDPNDLIDVALVAGAAIARRSLARVMTVYPADWKGQLPKKVEHRRTLTWLDSLDSSFRAIVVSVTPASLRHNALDATGQLHHLYDRIG